MTRAGTGFDKCVIVSITVCAYALIVAPLLMYLFPADSITAPRLENKIAWPAFAALALACLALRNRPRLSFPPHIICLFAYLALAGASVLWAFKPDFAFIRFSTQSMTIISIILPAMLAARTADMMRGVFLCYAFAAILNAVLILTGFSTESVADGLKIGYPGYFQFKGILGECAAVAIMISFYEVLFPGWRRILGIIVAVTAIYLMFVSQSKGSLGLALLAPLLAGFTLYIGKKLRSSPAIVLLPVPICYVVLDAIVGNLVNRLSWSIYGNYNLTGRTDIWFFVNSEIARRPLLGWGFKSFWLAGPDSPSLTDAGGWIRKMPTAHNGYLDTIVDTGYVGLALFVIFIFMTLHAIGRVADREPARGWLLLSIALFVILVNFLETGWMHGADMLWVIFLIVVAEAGRYWRPQQSQVGTGLVVRSRPVVAGARPALARAVGVGGLPRRRDSRT